MQGVCKSGEYLRVSKLKGPMKHGMAYAAARSYAGEETNRFVNLRWMSAAEARSEGLFHNIHRAQMPADSATFIVHVSLASWRDK